MDPWNTSWSLFRLHSAYNFGLPNLYFLYISHKALAMVVLRAENYQAYLGYTMVMDNPYILRT